MNLNFQCCRPSLLDVVFWHSCHALRGTCGGDGGVDCGGGGGVGGVGGSSSSSGSDGRQEGVKVVLGG